MVNLFKSKKYFQVPIAAFAASALITGCGGSSSDTSSSTTSSNNLTSVLSEGLSQIPSATGMTASSSSSSAATAANQQLNNKHMRTVSGTPPAIITLGSSNVDKYFYNGLIAKITASGWSSSSSAQADATAFWGGTDGSASGQGGCNMVANLGQAFGQMLNNANSTCYMKNIPSAASGVTISSGTAKDVFKQEAKDKLVQAKITNMTQNNGGQSQTMNMNVFITISGTNSVSGDVYKAHLYMCQEGQSQPMQDEVLTIKKSTGTFTDVSYQNPNSGNGNGYSSVSAFLKNNNGTIAFDPSQKRTMDSFYGSNSQTFKSHIEINSDNTILNQSYGSGSWGSNEIYTISQFSGTGLKDLAFLQGGFKGSNTCSGCPSGNQTNTFSGGVEFRDTFFAAAPSNSYATKVASENFATDSFYSNLTAPTFDFTQDNCSATPDITVTADFSNAALVAVQNTCEGDAKLLGSDLWSMCQSSSVNTAMQDVMQLNH